MIVKAAAVQISPVLYSREGTVAKVVRKIRELGSQGVQFATFPETVIPYYPYFAFVQPAYAMARNIFSSSNKLSSCPPYDYFTPLAKPASRLRW